ncbi:hypothetical protein C8R43DRAFT_1199790, partial [Mycena crocata]
QPIFSNTPLPPTSNKGLSRAPTASYPPNSTSTTSSPMPTTSSTTSLVAGGGDDLDNGRCHSRYSPSTRANTGGIVLVVANVELDVCAEWGGSLSSDPDLAVSDGADALGALSGPCSAHHNAPVTPSPTVTAHFGSGGKWDLWGSFATPARCFPRLNWPRRGSHAPIANMPLLGTGYAPLRQPALAAPDGALQIKLRGELGFFFSIWPVFTPSRRSRLTGAYSGGSLTSPLKNIPHRRFRCPWELSSASSPGESLVETTGALDLTVADWLFYRASKSFTKGRHANFQLELITAMDVSKPFTSEFLLQTARCLDSAKADSNVWEEFLRPGLSPLNLCDSPFLKSRTVVYDTMVLRSHSSAVHTNPGILRTEQPGLSLNCERTSGVPHFNLLCLDAVQYYMRLQYLNAKAMLVRSQVTWTLAFVDWQVIQRRSHSLLSRLEIHTLYRRVSSCQVLIHACFKPSWRKEFTYINNLFTLQLIVNRPLKLSRSLHQDAGHHSTPSMITFLVQLMLNFGHLGQPKALQPFADVPSFISLRDHRTSVRIEYFSFLEHGRTRGTEAASLETIHPRRIQVEEFLEGDSEVLYIFVLAGAEPRSCERLVSWDDTKTLTQKQEFRLTSHNSAPMPSKPRSVSSHRHTAPSPRQIRVLKECPAVAAPGGPRLSGPPSRIHMNTFIKSTYLHEFCVGSSKFALSAVVRAPHIAPASSPGFKVFQSRSFGLRTLGRTVSQPHQHIYSHPKTLISTYLLQFRADSFEPTLRIVVQTCRIVPGRSRRVGAGTSRRNPGASRPPGAQRIDATNTAARLSVKNGKSDLPPRRRAPIPIGLRSVSALRWSATSPRRIRSLEVPSRAAPTRTRVPCCRDCDVPALSTRCAIDVDMSCVNVSRLRDVCVVTRFAASVHGLGVARANRTVQRVRRTETGCRQAGRVELGC